MKTGIISLGCALWLAPALAPAGTLYQWQDEAGETRFGPRPPPGVVGSVVGEKLNPAAEASGNGNCRALQDEHLHMIDKEIARLRELPTGLGAEYEFTAEAKQRFVNELLAHRAAFLTGKAAETFLTPDKTREFNALKAKLSHDKAQLLEELQQQAQQIQQQRAELERQRRENLLLNQRPRGAVPGWHY